MSEEVRHIIFLIKSNLELHEYVKDNAKVLYSEPSIMHTIQIDDDIYKALYYEGKWKITLMK